MKDPSRSSQPHSPPKLSEAQRTTCMACKRLLNPPRSVLRQLLQTSKYTRITLVWTHFPLNQELGRSQVNRPRQQKTSEEKNNEDTTAGALEAKGQNFSIFAAHRNWQRSRKVFSIKAPGTANVKHDASNSFPIIETS